MSSDQGPGEFAICRADSFVAPFRDDPPGVEQTPGGGGDHPELLAPLPRATELGA